MIDQNKRKTQTEIHKKFLQVFIAKHELEISPDGLFAEIQSYISNKDSYKSKIKKLSQPLIDSCAHALSMKERTIGNITEEFVDLISLKKGGNKWTKLINNPSGDQSRNF